METKINEEREAAECTVLMEVTADQQGQSSPLSPRGALKKAITRSENLSWVLTSISEISASKTS